MKLIGTVFVIYAILLTTSMSAMADTILINELTEVDKQRHLCDRLCSASYNGDLEKMKLSIGEGANVNCTCSSEGFKPLHHATSLANFEVITNFNLGARKYSCRPPDELVNKKLQAVRLLIESGADVNGQKLDGQTALHTTRIVKFAEVLIEKGANVNVQDVYGRTPMLIVKSHYDKECNLGRQFADLFIKHGADVNHHSKFGETALKLMVSIGNAEDVKFLIAKGADINFNNNGTKSILENAIVGSTGKANARRMLIAEYLIDKGAYFENGGEYSGMNELHLAVEKNVFFIVNKLLANGVPVDKLDSRGNTALLKAVYKNNKKMAKLLINYGADVNVRDKLSDIPLFFYAQDEEMLELLLQSGADVTAKPEYSNENFHKYTSKPELSKIVKKYELEEKSTPKSNK